VNDIYAAVQYFHNMCTNTEEFDLSFGRNFLKNEFGDQAAMEMMPFLVCISLKNPNVNTLKRRNCNSVSIYLKLEFHVQFKIPEQFEVGVSLLSFGTQSFIFQFAIQKHKDQDTQNCNIASYFVWA
jgi:hypothetical protein